MSIHQPVVLELIELLKSRPDLVDSLTASIRAAHFGDVGTLEQYYEFLDAMVAHIPRDRDLSAILLKYYYLIDLSPDGLLQRDEAFQHWSHAFACAWGSFLDTTASAGDLKSFYSDPRYKIDDYYVSPSGWLTFNQFFARQLRPGKRPVDGPCDDAIVVSAADSIFKGQWPIQSDSRIAIKNMNWSIDELLEGSPYKDRFKNGIFVHSYLAANDYHRYHTPVAGVIKEARKISGHVTMDVIRKPDGSLESVDGTGYQFRQVRGLVVMESPLGLVAVLPIGMAQVSSVNLTAEVGATLRKGEEFGFFLFGGSDIVMLFEAGKVHIEAQADVRYNQGQRIGRALHR
jgi:phosphatidylserine decarboxylase